MKAILLAAGFGTRLRPLTNTIPKCLVPIKGKPLLQYWLEALSKADIKEFLINTHYLPKQVSHFIENSAYCDNSKVVYEETLLGTAGTLIANKSFYKDSETLLIHADNYCLEDLNLFIKAHEERPQNCLITMMLFETPTPKSCGIVKLDQNDIVVEFHEKVENPPGNLANAAVYILSKELSEMIIHNYKRATDFSTEILPYLVGKIYTYKCQKPYLDIGTPETYAKANSENYA